MQQYLHNIKKYKIGYRTVKTAVAVCIGITAAQFFRLDFFVSSAIITILCVQNSKKKSIHSAISRFVACMLAIPFSYLFFEVIGYNPISIGLLLLLFIPTTVLLKVNEGVVTSTVIILHIYSTSSLTWPVVWNELGLIVIGIGAALLVNSYMPSLDKEMKHHQKKIEGYFQELLMDMVYILRTEEMKEDYGSKLKRTAKEVQFAKTLAFRDVENHFIRKENYYYKYFTIREKQLEIISRLFDEMVHVHGLDNQKKLVADFLEELSLCVHSGNTAMLFLNKLQNLENTIKQESLPTNWNAFEEQAHIYYVIKEIEQYLRIKKSLKVA
ncbi:aromatic acid exporter family protein [Bacillus sp. B1-b2]|uniref:aromatic acid exporter family protein n=1 Tax=Bacillus sp. B1-b2 TaxID=2653201 RepID=UPI001261F03B|nr:aromatic acid exporter family protein [Bacillus sp. B1-b2]KAB7672990.1 aromatic acid exporter family protein [Bacillus sp. B1-b2]